jgi:hypothetical protein
LRELIDMQPRPRCPFYGFRWPARSSNLLEVGTAECGLDLDEHGLCWMETEQRPVDFERCTRRSEWKHLIDAGKKYIRFHGAELPGTGVPLEQWQQRVMQQK